MKNKIAFHDNSLTVRGTTTCIYNFAYWGRELLGLDPIIMYNSNANNEKEGYEKCAKEFPVIGYSDSSEIDKILDEKKCEYFFMKKGGSPDGILSQSCKNLVNACSGWWQPDWIHGDVYAMGSEWLSKITDYKIPYVSDVVILPEVDDNMREELGIPEYAFVFGRTGGNDTFDIPWVKEVILEALKIRNDIWFVFQNTDRFINHERVIHLPKSSCEINKVKFINSCDSMIHARYIGESFGVACAEFSLRNKPIITWDGSKETSHIDILGENGVYYSNAQDLFHIFLNIEKKQIKNIDWNVYRQFSPEPIMKKFKEVYL
jgi:hypothetical protein